MLNNQYPRRRLISLLLILHNSLMLSGSGIRVFVLGNMGLGWSGWGKVQVSDRGRVGVLIKYCRFTYKYKL